MNNAPSGSPMRGAAFDSWRSLRAAHAFFLVCRTEPPYVRLSYVPDH